MAGCIVLTGRAKDTIVLASGENIEPQPIEVSANALRFQPLSTW
jgi:long-subunit acyl-CoA synthetase (AMP-forming)